MNERINSSVFHWRSASTGRSMAAATLKNLVFNPFYFLAASSTGDPVRWQSRETSWSLWGGRRYTCDCKNSSQNFTASQMLKTKQYRLYSANHRVYSDSWVTPTIRSCRETYKCKQARQDFSSKTYRQKYLSTRRPDRDNNNDVIAVSVFGLRVFVPRILY